MFCAQHPDCLAELKIGVWLSSCCTGGDLGVMHFFLLPTNSMSNIPILGLELEWRGSSAFLQRCPRQAEVKQFCLKQREQQQFDLSAQSEVSRWFCGDVCRCFVAPQTHRAERGAANLGKEPEGHSMCSEERFEPLNDVFCPVQCRTCPPV